MTVSRLSLDGRWEFMHVSGGLLPQPVEIRHIVVPGPWQAQFADLRMRSGIGIYRREFEFPAEWLRHRVFLRFGAVFHNARVWLNGGLVGSHEGGFLPFGFDITDHLVAGINEIKVRVESPTDDQEEFPHAPLAEIPFGKQSWYGPLAGIWQPVHLECRIPDHMARVAIKSDRETGKIAARVVFAHPLTKDTCLMVHVLDGGENRVAAGSFIVPEGSGAFEAGLRVPDPEPWSPDSPALYRLALTMQRAGTDVDSDMQTFGFRTIESREGRLFLNGKPLYLRAALDQDYYPDTICTLPSVAFIEDQFRKAKELGLNCLRCHIKAADPRYYEAADRLGLLIWAELPNGGLATDQSRARMEELLRGMVDRDGNHPSIICWTIVNENWGVDLVHDEDHRAWLKQTYHWLKAYDPTRLVVDNSPVAPTFHVQSDLADYHFYAAIPDSRGDWDRFVDELAGRPAWLFSPEGDAVSTGTEPLLCSEFGNWGLPDPELLKDENREEPWWFETGHDWGEGIMYAHGVEHRFCDWSLHRVFGTLRNFVGAAQWQQYRALKYEIEAMRRKPTIAGYVITELTDCHWESNGLLDMRRNRRVFHDCFRRINADTVIVPGWKRVAFWAGELARFDVAIAHGAGAALAETTLEIALGGTKVLPLPRQEPGTVFNIGSMELGIPAVAIPTRQKVQFTLKTAAGVVVAENELDIAVHPRRTGLSVGQSVWSPDSAIADRLTELGYRLADNMETADLIVAVTHDAAMARHVRHGGRLLLLPDQEESLDPFFPHWQPARIRSREGTVWRGDWASSFSWLRRTGPFKVVPGGPMLDETFDRVIPERVISGCNLIDFQARVHAGLVVGWIHKPVALAVERRYGKGRILVSTFRLFRDPASVDPTATVLLDVLIRQSLVGTET
jgi:hypothetical protein